jgi:hypothetical protein
MCRLPLTGEDIIETLFAPVPSVNAVISSGGVKTVDGGV